MERTMEMYGGKVHGVAVSHYGLECGYLDYRALAGIVGDMILNNDIFGAVDPWNWELAWGEDECEIYQFYIISERGYEILRDFTDEVVYYNSELDLYLWCITHFGTSWDYVLTDIKLKEML